MYIFLQSRKKKVAYEAVLQEVERHDYVSWRLEAEEWHQYVQHIYGKNRLSRMPNEPCFRSRVLNSMLKRSGGLIVLTRHGFMIDEFYVARYGLSSWNQLTKVEVVERNSTAAGEPTPTETIQTSGTDESADGRSSTEGRNSVRPPIDTAKSTDISPVLIRLHLASKGLLTTDYHQVDLFAPSYIDVHWAQSIVSHMSSSMAPVHQALAPLS